MWIISKKRLNKGRWEEEGQVRWALLHWRWALEEGSSPNTVFITRLCWRRNAEQETVKRLCRGGQSCHNLVEKSTQGTYMTRSGTLLLPQPVHPSESYHPHENYGALCDCVIMCHRDASALPERSVEQLQSSDWASWRPDSDYFSFNEKRLGSIIWVRFFLFLPKYWLY